VVVYTFLAAILRSMGEVPWLLWSGYPGFTLQDGFELAILPLLAVIVGGWLEEQDHKIETEQSHHREAERIVASQRKETMQHFHDDLLVILSKAEHASAEFPVEFRERVSEIVLSVLQELDGKGKGELLHLLFEKSLVTGESPLIALSGTDFGRANLHNAHLEGICLIGVDLSNALMDGVHLSKSRLSASNMSRAFLRHADLREATLTGCQLNGANMENANLEGADLSDASLEAAFLRHANLKHCKLNRPSAGDTAAAKADPLTGKIGIPESLALAILIDTILPDGRKVTNEKGKEYLRNKEIALLVDKL
jgi:hypothetical protein